MIIPAHESSTNNSNLFCHSNDVDTVDGVDVVVRGEEGEGVVM